MFKLEYMRFSRKDVTMESLPYLLRLKNLRSLLDRRDLSLILLHRVSKTPYILPTFTYSSILPYKRKVRQYTDHPSRGLLVFLLEFSPF